MAVTPASFRSTFPEFTDSGRYPDPQIAFWITASVAQVNEARWGELTDLGVSLQVAHQLALSTSTASGSPKSVPGTAVTGVVSSKSVGGVSVSYDTNSAIEEGGGHWNLTTYGTRYIRLARQIGAGPVEVNVPSVESVSATAWPGPYLSPF